MQIKKLYHFSLSPFCRKIRLILGEKKIDIELIEERFWEKRVQFLKINHSGEVPVYIENDIILSDSNAITEYLEEKYNDTPLFPNCLELKADLLYLKI